MAFSPSERHKQPAAQKKTARILRNRNGQLNLTSVVATILRYITGIEAEYKEDRDFFKRIRMQVNEVAAVCRSPHNDDQDKFVKL
jgi:hypothetical protein